MSYLAIARKYRPATFDEIAGQEHVTRTLRNAITRDRIHHAYLFSGARGVGKTTAARALAKALNCEQGPTPDPCGVCVSCREIAAGTSPDLVEIDGASNNSVDDVRELRETVRYAPTRGRKRIFLVDEVHMLSTAAFNALLKTLEEPPPHVVFLFATTEPHKIPDTILSRVQRFDFKRIPVRVVARRLGEIAEAEGATLSEDALRRIARAGEGSMRDAQSLLDKIISFAGPEVDDETVAETLGLIDRGLLHDLLGALLRGEAALAFDGVARIHDYGHEMSRLTEDLLELVRHATFVITSPEARAHVDLPEEELVRLEALGEHTSAEALGRLFHALLEVHEQVSRASRPRLVLEMALARLADVRPVEGLGVLVGRLEALERRLRAEGGGGGGGGTRTPGRRAGPGRAHRRAPVPTRARTGSRRRATRTAASPPEDASDDDRWAALVEALGGEADPLAPALASGIARRRGTTLVVTLAAGPTLSAARLELEQEAVRAAVAAAFGSRLDVTLEASLASRNAGVDAALERGVLRDDACLRVLDRLGGVLTDVRPDVQPDPPASADAPSAAPPPTDAP